MRAFDPMNRNTHNPHDALNGGSRVRLAKYRRALQNSLQTIRACRTPEAAERFIAEGGYTSPLNHRGAWMGDAHGMAPAIANASKSGHDCASAPWGLVDGWRDVGDAADIVSMRHTGWYADEGGSELYVGHVWQLPARDGSPRYVAGYIEKQFSRDNGRSSGYVVLSLHRGNVEIFEDKDDAARAADSLAESQADKSREYDENWREASRHNDKREDARADLKQCAYAAHAVIKAWRAQKKAGPLAPEVCAILRHDLADMRKGMRRAMQAIARHADAIESLGMAGEF